jgi:hypothetical protein
MRTRTPAHAKNFLRCARARTRSRKFRVFWNYVLERHRVDETGSGAGILRSTASAQDRLKKDFQFLNYLY